MSATRPAPEVFSGRYLSISPLVHEDIPALYAAISHPEVFAAGFGGGPAAYRDSLDGFTEWALGYFDWNNSNVHAIRVRGGDHDGVLIGTSTLGDFELAHESAHLGWTAYDPRVWGSAVNAEAKLYILGRAFDNGFGRVKIQADSLNVRSRAAIEKLGAIFEGVLRRDMARADGSFRDSAVYSILASEWPAVREKLIARCDQFADRPLSLTGASAQ